MPKVKIFSSGKYPQGEFTKEKTKKVFENAKDTNAIYIHSSHWDNKEPITLGTFKDYEIRENGENVDVYATLELNEKGKEYNNDGIFNGVSVEVNTASDTLDKIALLPLGVEPAVQGAVVNFEQATNKIIFQNQINLKKEVKHMDKNAILEAMKKLSANDIKSIMAEFEEKPTPKTEAEIRREVEKEFETKAEIKELIEASKKKVTPVLMDMVEFALEMAGKEKEKIIEFSKDEKMSYFEKFKKQLSEMQELQLFENKTENMEFESNKEKAQFEKDKKYIETELADAKKRREAMTD